MADLGKLVLLLGLLLVVLGGLLMLSPKLPFLGRLPGDIHVQRGDWSFHFPLATSLLLSVVLSLVLMLFSRR
jgi:thiosulfate reductase cytochrome b subunit